MGALTPIQGKNRRLHITRMVCKGLRGFQTSTGMSVYAQ
ncbi:MAG: hypothetical protein OJF50_003483 [Nitrospira sp.]|nr:hypothetical protein [Nitrospira sp.]